MANEHTIARYRKFYALLVRLYPRPYRERFGEGIVQTFGDLCRERAIAGKGLFAFVVWMFTETLLSIMKESYMVNKNIVRIAIATGLILLIPLLGQAPWSLFDFVIAGILLFGTGLCYEFVSRKGGTTAYRVAVGIASVTGFLLIWTNLAVGLIGNENNPANLLYAGVFAVGLIGAGIAGFQPRGMSRALFATAVAQALVPVIAMIIWRPPFNSGVVGVLILNAVFVVLWVASGLLFRQAAPLWSGISANNQ